MRFTAVIRPIYLSVSEPWTAHWRRPLSINMTVCDYCWSMLCTCFRRFNLRRIYTAARDHQLEQSFLVFQATQWSPPPRLVFRHQKLDKRDMTPPFPLHPSLSPTYPLEGLQSHELPPIDRPKIVELRKYKSMLPKLVPMILSNCCLTFNLHITAVMRGCKPVPGMHE